jgi:sarcosine oxidase, subunit gamma
VSDASTAALREAARDAAVVLAHLSIAAAWNVQGARVAATVQTLFGVTLDDTPNTVTSADAISALWLGPASWLLVSGSALGDFGARRAAIQAAGGALFDLSASRVACAVSGARALDVLAAGCPLDLHPDAFTPGRCAQSVFGRVSALYCRAGTGVVVLVPRSFGRDVWHGLCEAAGEYGYVEQPTQTWRAPYGW